MQGIFVHGLGQTPDCWEKTLAACGFPGEPLCPDLSALIRGQTPEYRTLYRAFAALCGDVPGPLDLCGLSLGGVLALNYAADFPDKVRSLVLIAAQYRMPKHLLRFQNLLFRLMPDAMFASTGFGKRAFIRLCGTMAELDFRARLPAVTCPALVVCGGRDSANKRASAELAQLLGGAELRMIPDAGHELNTEAPEQLAMLLDAFYERLGAGK